MIIKSDRTFETNSMFLSEDWYNEGNYIIDETTEEGQQMVQTYIENHPFVDFEHDGEFITKVIVLEDEKLAEQERLEQEKLEQELIENLKPSDKEVLMAEIELNTINLLIESGVI